MMPGAAAMNEYAEEGEANFKSHDAFEASEQYFRSAYKLTGGFTLEVERDFFRYWLHFPFDVSNGDPDNGYPPDELQEIINGCLARGDHVWRSAWVQRLAAIRSRRKAEDTAGDELRVLLETWGKMYGQQGKYPLHNKDGEMLKTGMVFTMHLFSVARRIRYLTRIDRPEVYMASSFLNA
uniref:Uncharacterized protein n=1 Tax=Mycena chlorophos TaxID=658473 RepID=A0ABQ0L847_MYCCL|nr:predicted protein [Mycena chlorophos]